MRYSKDIMKIELLSIDEKEYGSAEAVLDLDEAGKLYLIELGFNALLVKGLELVKHEEK